MNKQKPVVVNQGGERACQKWLCSLCVAVLSLCCAGYASSQPSHVIGESSIELPSGHPDAVAFGTGHAVDLNGSSAVLGNPYEGLDGYGGVYYFQEEGGNGCTKRR